MPIQERSNGCSTIWRNAIIPTIGRLSDRFREVELQRLSGCRVEHLDFHPWYLKEKGWIKRTENGMFAITVDGSIAPYPNMSARPQPAS
ncbi:hypothetical protein QY048_30890 [Bradyrhizobium sp. WYCCWR 12677]|nr:hypothetical protein [Bradyrhizobium sp. WYCCWR 12677]MDN5005266.1 hypothetical protein [Bradyrhizobium sp. WYCCWR 12677]